MIVRSDPIPPGFYWLDLIGDAGRDAFNEWIELWQGAAMAREIRRSEYSQRDWVLFEVRLPVRRWTSRALGLPTVAPKGAATLEADTERAPQPEGFPDLLRTGDLVEAVESTRDLVVVVGGLVLLGWLLLRR
jgi:hypothetical protein